MLLQSHQSFTTLADYDLATNAFTMLLSRPNREESQAIVGEFDYLGDQVALLFRAAGELYLQIGNQRFRMDRVTVKLESTAKGRLLRVSVDGKSALEVI